MKSAGIASCGQCWRSKGLVSHVATYCVSLVQGDYGSLANEMTRNKFNLAPDSSGVKVQRAWY